MNYPVTSKNIWIICGKTVFHLQCPDGTFQIDPLATLYAVRRSSKAYTLGEVPAVKSGSSRRNIMKSSTKDKAKGAFDEAKGKANEVAGKITDNPTLEAKGKAEKVAGKVQQKVGQVKKVLGK
jgi:uncharacterized protein YjbJ (UPF0337 family)